MLLRLLMVASFVVFAMPVPGQVPWVRVSGLPEVLPAGVSGPYDLEFEREEDPEEKRVVFLVDVHRMTDRERLSQVVLDNDGSGYTELEGSLPFELDVPEDERRLYVAAWMVPWSLNRAIVERMLSYPTDGTFTYSWDISRPGDYGVTQEVRYLGSIICPAYPGTTTYCSGVAFETYVLGANEYNAQYGHARLGTMSVSDMQEFRRIWYGIREAEHLATKAIPDYNLGERLSDWEEFQTGDAIQFWRMSGSGHNPLFVRWIRNTSGQITGVRYWGSQNSSNGIGYANESFSTGGSGINPNRMHGARIRKPRDEADYDWALAKWFSEPFPEGWAPY